MAIAQRCNLTIPLGKNYLPEFPTPPGVTIDEHLHNEAVAGLEARLAQLYPDAAVRDGKRPEYMARLEFETKTIQQMGFAGYFLIVADFINWAKHNHVPVGPGRGSGAGSLVAYSLGITGLDPLRYALLFERFLNPERVSMPDFDIDFCQNGRDRVIDYVKQKYGADSVSQIATFGTLAARAAVRDVGRVLDMPYTFVDGIAKLIPFQPGKQVLLQRPPASKDDRDANAIYAREQEPLLVEREAAEEEVRQLLELAEQLEGLPRNVGMHAGGVLIAPGKLTDFCPLYVQPGADAILSQFDKDDVEAIGLVKFDFLGLTTLTILDWTLKYIRQLDPQADIVLDALPLDDRAAYDIFKTGNTVAVFQFESRGMRDLLKQAPPTRFEDVIALVALYRPGPMALIPDYVARKSGRERVPMPDPRLEPILETDLRRDGVPGAGDADRAGDRRLLAGRRRSAAPRDGQEEARGNGHAPEHLRRRRGEEPCHRRAARRCSSTTWRSSPATASTGRTPPPTRSSRTRPRGSRRITPPRSWRPTCRWSWTTPTRSATSATTRSRWGLQMLPPDVNASNYRFEPVDAKQIRYGLGGIKGTGQSAIEAVVAARAAGGPFRDLFDFCRRVDKRAVNRRAVEALVRAGAFDAIEPRRAALLASVGMALEAAERAEANAAQVSLFGEESAERSMGLVAARDWSDAERLQNEKSAVGFYLSGHPFHGFAAELAPVVRTALSDLAPRNGSVLVAGIVTQMRVQNGRRGRMAFVTLDDGRGSTEIMVYNEVYDSVRNLLRDDQLVIAEVKVTQRMTDDGEYAGLRIIAENIYDLATVRRKFAKGLKLACNGNASAARLAEILQPFRPGDKPVTISYRNERIGGDVALPEAWRVNLDDALLDRLREWLQPENVQVISTTDPAPRSLAAPRLPAAVERAGHLGRRLAHHAHGAADGGHPRHRRQRLRARLPGRRAVAARRAGRMGSRAAGSTAIAAARC